MIVQKNADSWPSIFKLPDGTDITDRLLPSIGFTLQTIFEPEPLPVAMQDQLAQLEASQ
jgi:hypothetical protein